MTNVGINREKQEELLKGYDELTVGLLSPPRLETLWMDIIATSPAHWLADQITAKEIYVGRKLENL